MGTERWSLLFQPGTYGTDAEPLQIKVGYYTEVAGLGRLPGRRRDQRQGRGLQPVPRRGPPQPYCVALNNFWRSLSNLTIQVNGTGPGRLPRLGQLLGRRQAVVAAPGRHPRRQPLADGLLHRGPAVRQRRLPRRLPAGYVINGSQQQWITRNSEVGSWSNGVWNQVFAGTIGAPSEARLPDPPYTTLDDDPAQPREAVPVRRRRRRLAGAGARRARPTRAAPTGPTAPTAGPQPAALRLPRRPPGRLGPRARLPAGARQEPPAHPRGLRHRPQPRGQARRHRRARHGSGDADRRRRRRPAGRRRPRRRRRRRRGHRRRGHRRRRR